MHPQRNSIPSSFNSRTRRSTAALSILKSGMPYNSSPPGRSSRSKTVTRCPARFSCCAAARPAGPLPTTATRLPVRTSGGWGTTHPSSHARSAIACSIVLIVTGRSFNDKTQDSSHGAGQIRPVNSGKLFVLIRDWYASNHRPRYTRSFQSGIWLPSGQPWLQNGTPQSMHRAPCCRSSPSPIGR